MSEILFIVATLAATLNRTPKRWLILLSLIGELFSLLPPGIMTTIVWVPWVMVRLWRRRFRYE